MDSEALPDGWGELVSLARWCADRGPSTDVRQQGQSVADELVGPLRVAIAGRVKAGKSTLLNALVSERLAPTDAGECTRIVTTYRHGSGYHVGARMKSGRLEATPFRRTERGLVIELGALAEDDIDRLEVEWPSKALDKLTLIDTPGLSSLTDTNSRRTKDFLGVETSHAAEADAVIYLMRHVHRDDMSFLEAFQDSTVSATSPVNAIAILSRADEIGAGRPDAMESAALVASRYQRDPKIAKLCSQVLPVAGLLAETGLTLREEEAAAIRALAEQPPDDREWMLMSVDQFTDFERSPLSVAVRQHLLDRLALFGIGLAMREVDQGNGNATRLGPRLVAHSGLGDVRAVLQSTFVERARVLKVRSAMIALRELGVAMRARDPRGSERVMSSVDRIEASAIGLSRLRAAHLVLSGAARLKESEREPLERILLKANMAEMLGLEPGSSNEVVKAMALSEVARWRTRAGDPLSGPLETEVFEAAARTGETIFGLIRGRESGSHVRMSESGGRG